MAPPIKLRGTQQLRLDGKLTYDVLPTLTDDKDVATKKYVDDHGGGGAGVLTKEEKTTWQGESTWLIGFTPTQAFILTLNGVALHETSSVPPPLPPLLAANEYYYDVGGSTIYLWAAPAPGSVLELTYIDTSGGGSAFTREAQSTWNGSPDFPLLGAPTSPFIVTLNGVFQHEVLANPGPNEYTYAAGTVTFWQAPQNGEVAEAFYL